MAKRNKLRSQVPSFILDPDYPDTAHFGSSSDLK